MIDPTNLRELWRSHGSRLLIIARSIGEPAEDAVQEAFVALATQRELPHDPLAWLVRVTRNQLLQWRRGGERRRQREQIAGSARWFQPAVDATEQRLDAEQAVVALQRLTAETREIVVMHVWGEMSFKSIAEVIGCSPATTHRRYSAGLQQLQRELNPNGRSNNHLPSTTTGVG